MLEKEDKTARNRFARIEETINDGLMTFHPEVVRQGVIDIEQAAINCGAIAGALGEARTYAARGNEFTRDAGR